MTSSTATTTSARIRRSTCAIPPSSTGLHRAPTAVSASSTTRSTTAPSPSPTAAASASARRKINLSTVFAGQNVGVKEVDEQIWLVSFMHYDLGFFDDETCRLEPPRTRSRAKVLPMSPV